MNKTRVKFSVALIVIMISVLFVPADTLFGHVQASPAELITMERGSAASLAAFPVGLQYVDNEAFAGTAFEIAIFEHSLVYIGSNAFSDVVSLSDVYIPERTEYIGEHAFLTSAVVHGVEGTYVHKWAEQNGNRFQADDIWNCKGAVKSSTFKLLRILPFIVCPVAVDRKVINKTYGYIRSMRPQDRAELYEINYRFP